MRIETTISKEYVFDWGVKEGLREIIQNAVDANKNGFKMGVSYSRKNKKLIIFNRGATLNREALLLGSTTKRDDKTQLGQYGEGFKVGALALIRNKKSLSIFTKKEVWSPIICEHSKFESDVLGFDIKQHKSDDDRLTFEVDNITPQEWAEFKSVFLPLLNLDDEFFIPTPDGKVILHKDLKGKIFVGGIYINEIKDLEYGYNFNPSVIPLNRDRNMVSSFDVQWKTSQMWAFITASKKGKLFDLTDMLKRDMQDVKYIKEFADYSVKGRVVDKFLKDNPPKSYPVTNEDEAKAVRSLGYTPHYSSSSYAGTVRESLGTIEDLKRTVEMNYQLFRKMTPIDDANISWVFGVMHKYDHKFRFKVEIAKFHIETTRSVCHNDFLVVNSNLLSSKFDILHEVVGFYCFKNDGVKDTHVWKRLYQLTIEGMTVAQ